MLVLIGLGLFDEKDLTLRGLEEARKSDKVFIEMYTSKWHGNLENLRKLIGKEVVELKRKDLEENSMKILEDARSSDIAILVPCDPLVATVHASLLLEAKKLGIETKVVHNASIVSAIAETGLHIHRFGPPITIPFPEKTKGQLPESVYEVIKENKKRGLHTLCLLDVVAEENKYLSVSEGLETLLEIEEQKKEGVVARDSDIVVLCRAGSDSSKQYYGKVKDLIGRNFGEPPTVFIVLGKLHFTEKEYLDAL